MGSVGVSASAGNIAKLTAELVLNIAGQRPSATAAAAAAAAAGAGALGNLQRRFLLLVLLTFKVLLVSLMH